MSSPAALRTILITTVAIAGLLGFVYAMYRMHGISIRYLMRDPVATLREATYLGAISHLGILAWTTGAAISLFCWNAVRNQAAAKPGSRFLLWAGLLTAVLCLDDLFLIHERLGPRYLGLDDDIIISMYGLCAVALVLRFWTTIMQTHALLLLAAVAALGGSVLLDFAVDRRMLSGIGPEERVLAEDGAKLLGICLWSAYLIDTALDLVRGVLREPATPDATTD